MSTTLTQSAAKANVARVLEDIQASLESIRSDEMQVIGSPSVGDVIRQGDIKIVYLGDHWPKTSDAEPQFRTADSAQLAPGSTKGSRHILTGDGVAIRNYAFKIANAAIVQAVGEKQVVELHAALVGPIFHSESAMTVTHPEHGDIAVPAGCYAVVYQRAYDEEVRRQQD